MHPIDAQNRQTPRSELVTLVLRTFALAYSKTIDLVYSELSKGHVSDGEDCWLDHYGLPVQMTDSVPDIDNALDQALGWLDEYDGKLHRESQD